MYQADTRERALAQGGDVGRGGEVAGLAARGHEGEEAARRPGGARTQKRGHDMTAQRSTGAEERGNASASVSILASVCELVSELVHVCFRFACARALTYGGRALVSFRVVHVVAHTSCVVGMDAALLRRKKHSCARLFFFRLMSNK